MVKLLKIFILLLLPVLSYGQTVKEAFAGYANISAISGSGPTYTISLVGFIGNSRFQPNGQYIGSNAAISDVIYADCARYIITNISSSSYTTLSVTVEVPATDWALGITPPNINQRVAVVSEIEGIPVLPPTADGNGGPLSSIDNFLYQCILNHQFLMLMQTKNTLNEITDYVGILDVAPAVPASSYTAETWRNSVGQLYYSNGSTWLTDKEVKLTDVSLEGSAAGIYKIGIDTLGVDTLYVSNNNIFRRFEAGGSLNVRYPLIGAGTLLDPLKIDDGVSAGNTLMWDGADWAIQDLTTDATLAGNGWLSTPLKLAQNGATTGQVLKWDGTTWLPANSTSGIDTVARYYPYREINPNYRLQLSTDLAATKLPRKIALLGDSYFDNPGYLYYYIAEKLAIEDGITGGAFTIKNAVGSGSSVTTFPVYSGTWTTENIITNAPLTVGAFDGQSAKTSTPGSSIIFQSLAVSTWDGSGLFTNAKIFTLNSSAVYRIRVDGGSWTTVTTTSGGTLNTYNIAGLSLSTHSIEIEHVSGNLTVFGGVFSSSSVGAEIYKMGVSGATARNWKPLVKTTLWKEQVRKIDPDIILVHLGLNDNAIAGYGPEEFGRNLDTIAINIRAAIGDSADIMFLAPITPIPGYTMQPSILYRNKHAATALKYNSGFLSLYDLYNGSYNWGVSNGCIDPSGIHTTGKGSRYIAQEIVNNLKKGTNYKLAAGKVNTVQYSDGKYLQGLDSMKVVTFPTSLTIGTNGLSQNARLVLQGTGNGTSALKVLNTSSQDVFRIGQDGNHMITSNATPIGITFNSLIPANTGTMVMRPKSTAIGGPMDFEFVSGGRVFFSAYELRVTGGGGIDVTGFGKFSGNASAANYTTTGNFSGKSSNGTQIWLDNAYTGARKAGIVFKPTGSWFNQDIGIAASTSASLTPITDLDAKLWVRANGLLEQNSTSAFKIASGTTGERPSALRSLLRYNSTTEQFEGCRDGINWENFGTTSGTGVANQWAFWTGANTLSTSNLLTRDASNYLSAQNAAGFGLPKRTTVNNNPGDIYIRTDLGNIPYYSFGASPKPILTGGSFWSIYGGSYSASGQYIPELNSIMYGTNGARWAKTTSGGLGPGETHVVTYTMNTVNMLHTSANGGLTYPVGRMTFSHYYNRIPQSISVRLRNAAGTWFGPYSVNLTKTLNTNTDGLTLYPVYYLDIGAITNYVNIIEITTVGNAAGTIYGQYTDSGFDYFLNEAGDIKSPFKWFNKFGNEYLGYTVEGVTSSGVSQWKLSNNSNPTYFNNAGAVTFLSVGTDTTNANSALSVRNGGADNNAYYGLNVRTIANNPVFATNGLGQTLMGTESPTSLTTRTVIHGLGSTSGTSSLAVHNSTGTNNAFIVRDDGNVGVGTALPAEKFTVKDNNTASSYILGVHADDQSPWAAGFFNDTYSTTNPVFTYFGRNDGSFEMGTQASKTLTIFQGYGSPRLTMLTSGDFNLAQKLGVGGITPTARIHIAAGTSSLNTAPVKFTVTGAVLNTTPEVGAFEVDAANRAYYTGASGARNTIAYLSDVGATVSMKEESFTATAAQTTFTIAYSAPAPSGTSMPLRVYRNGVRLKYVASGPTSTQFTYTTTTVTTTANAAGDVITIEYLN